MELNIATAPAKNTKIWKNQKISWADIIDKLRTPVRTGETMAEYKAMPKSERDERKDRGGFVGGYLIGGRRKKDTVKYRSLITLDADNCTKDDGFFSSASELLKNLSAAMYTTHSHTAEKPRWRIVIPLAQTIEPEKYEPIARKIAEKIGIEYFDPTTYEASRLMHWPSCSEDGEYRCEEFTGAILVPDSVLALYEDWRDMSAWPIGQTEVKAHRRELKKLGDPREKNGIVGTFCRTFTIEEAIAEFLSDVYTPTDVPNRYTYAHGSTAGGVIIYDDGLHAYSHHATDPISGQDVNAFDLVRLNLFGLKDEDAKDGTPVNKLPSYTAMVQFAEKNKKVSAQLANEMYDNGADSLLSSAPVPDPAKNDDDKSWVSKLTVNLRTREFEKTAHNFLLILMNDKRLKGTVGLDDFSHRLLVKNDLPWRKKSRSAVWQDADDASLRNYISLHYQGLSSRQTIDDAFSEVVVNNRFHQVNDWLKLQVWDGTSRADRLLIDFLGAEDSEYTREITKYFLLAAIARVQDPGCKFDQCLVLTGPQGIGKSTVLARLGGRWFNDSIVTMQGKDALEQLQGSWIIELAEMQAANRAENDMIKAFISRQVDKFRAPYGRRTEEYPRQCVFAATTNDDVFLKDRTGARRFWVIQCPGGGNKPLDQLDSNYVGQVWAELMEIYKKGMSLYPGDAVMAEAQRLQKESSEGSELEGQIQEYLDMLLPNNWKTMSLKDRRYFVRNTMEGEGMEVAGTVKRDKVCALEIWCELLGEDINNIIPYKIREINTVLRNISGWKKPNKTGILRFEIYGRQRGLIREMSAGEKQKTD